ncbi:hypothetical protein L7F22_051432 [Adiantum nelumboides]|nr:hypothetical protein [Adiantum nelumboides]
MGILRFKLPHAWFYKQSKTGERVAYTPGSTLSGKDLVSAFLSPANHKAIDIPSPAESPENRQPSAEASSLPDESSQCGFTHTFPDDIAILSTLHPIEIVLDGCSINNSPSAKRTASNHLEHSIMDYCSDGDQLFHDFSTPKSKSGSANNGAAFDAKELEWKLKALESEDRRSSFYASSPILSGALSTPMVETCPMQGPDGSPYYRQNQLRGGNVRKSPMAVLANASPLFDRRIAGDDSSNESNSLRQSTSSSDTGIERRSSSQWERDAFSVNSERSETFTTYEDRLDRSNRMKKQRSPARMHRKRMDSMVSAESSPFTYPISNAGMSAEAFPGLYHDQYEHANFGHVKKDRNRSHHGFARKDQLVALRHINMQGHYNNGSIPVGDMADAENVEWGGLNSNDYRSPSRASPTSSRSSLQRGQHAVELNNKFYPAVSLHPVLPIHEQDSYQLPHAELKSKRGGDGFSYMGCKERLLSGRTSFEQGNDTTAASEGEVQQRLSNYDKFKLRQMTSTQGKLSRTWSLSPELGPYRSIQANRNPPSNAPNLTRHESYQNTPEHHYAVRGTSQKSEPVLDPSKFSPYKRGSNGPAMSNLSYANAQKGPSWSNKATLKAVREKTRDPGFESFSSSPQPGEAHSRVFDSFAVVKCSYDPKQDFKQSMVEMIFEKDLNSSHDMVELLQCYLTLNPPRYHDTIVKVFTEVWSEVFQDV